MRAVRKLEIHVAHGCNLTCESCSHYSNQGHTGLVSLEEADDWMTPWSGRISPRMFSLLGGEPTLHPQLPEFVSLARRHWPHALLRLVTNGFLLHRHPGLPAALKEAGKTYVLLSVHHNSPEYRERVRPNVELLREWVAQYGIRAGWYLSYHTWTRRYRGFGATMAPYEDGRPRLSWQSCPAKFCPQLFEGRIWKCAPLAYLGMQDDRYGLSGRWQPYLAYTPLKPGCTDEELNGFLDREHEPCCGMCPARPERMRPPLPFPSLSGASSSTSSTDGG